MIHELAGGVTWLADFARKEIDQRNAEIAKLKARVAELEAEIKRRDEEDEDRHLEASFYDG